MFLKNRNTIFKMKISKVTDYAALTSKNVKEILKPHSHCAGVATVHPDAGQPVYRDAPGHIS